MCECILQHPVYVRRYCRIFVVLTKTSQSIWNFLNCWGVIYRLSWGSLAVNVFAYVAWEAASLACLRIHGSSPIDVTASSRSIALSNICNVPIVNFSLANTTAWVLAEDEEIPASTKFQVPLILFAAPCRIFFCHSTRVKKYSTDISIHCRPRYDQTYIDKEIQEKKKSKWKRGRETYTVREIER